MNSVNYGHDKFLNLLHSSLLFIISVDTVFNGCYIYQMISEVNTDLFQSLFFTFALSGGYFALARIICTFGIRRLPTFNSAEYAKSFPVWLGGSLIIAILSFCLTVLFLGLLPAQDAYIKKTVQKTTDVAGKVIKAQRMAQSLEAPLISIINKAEIMLENEKKKGSVCGKGAGKGECATVIEGLQSVAVATRNQIIESASSSGIVIRRIESNLDTLQRLTRKKDIDFALRIAYMKDEISLMVLDVEALQKIIPLSALQTAIDTFSREFLTMGLGDMGATRIKGDFHPVAEQLRRKYGYLKEISQLQVKPFHSPSKMDILAEGIDTILPIVGIAFLMAFAPIGLIFCVLVSRGSNDHKPPSSNDWQPPSYDGYAPTDSKAFQESMAEMSSRGES